MKIRILRIPALLILLICCCVSALCEEAGRVTLVPGEEWSWSRGAYNTFSGQIGLKEHTGTDGFHPHGVAVYGNGGAKPAGLYLRERKTDRNDETERYRSFHSRCRLPRHGVYRSVQAAGQSVRQFRANGFHSHGRRRKRAVYDPRQNRFGGQRIRQSRQSLPYSCRYRTDHSSYCWHCRGYLDHCYYQGNPQKKEKKDRSVIIYADL